MSLDLPNRTFHNNCEVLHLGTSSMEFVFQNYPSLVHGVALVQTGDSYFSAIWLMSFVGGGLFVFCCKHSKEALIIHYERKESEGDRKRVNNSFERLPTKYYKVSQLLKLYVAKYDSE